VSRQVVQFIDAAIVMGWDAWIAAKPGKALFRLSHDDRIEIYARSQPSALLDAFAALGLKIRKRGLRRRS
jgi:hypothetical protein